MSDDANSFDKFWEKESGCLFNLLKINDDDTKAYLYDRFKYCWMVSRADMFTKLMEYVMETDG